MGLKGLTWDSFRRNYSLAPLFAVVFFGVSAAVLYPLRLAVKAPDVSWNSRKNPEPWKEYANKEYKFYSTRKEVKSPAPEY